MTEDESLQWPPPMSWGEGEWGGCGWSLQHPPNRGRWKCIFDPCTCGGSWGAWWSLSFQPPCPLVHADSNKVCRGNWICMYDSPFSFSSFGMRHCHHLQLYWELLHWPITDQFCQRTRCKLIDLFLDCELPTPLCHVFHLLNKHLPVTLWYQLDVLECGVVWYGVFQGEGGAWSQPPILIQSTNEQISTKKWLVDDGHHHVDEGGVFVDVDNLVDNRWLCVALLLISRLDGGELCVKGCWYHQALAVVVLAFCWRCHQCQRKIHKTDLVLSLTLLLPLPNCPRPHYQSCRDGGGLLRAWLRAW